MHPELFGVCSFVGGAACLLVDMHPELFGVCSIVGDSDLSLVDMHSPIGVCIIFDDKGTGSHK